MADEITYATTAKLTKGGITDDASEPEVKLTWAGDQRIRHELNCDNTWKLLPVGEISGVPGFFNHFKSLDAVDIQLALDSGGTNKIARIRSGYPRVVIPLESSVVYARAMTGSGRLSYGISKA